MTDLEALKARLREVESSRPDIIGISTHWHRNPEGPEAADAIERLEADAIALTTYRENLRDECRELLAKVERLEAENARLTKLAKDNNTLARMYKAQADEFRQKYVAALKG